MNNREIAAILFNISVILKAQGANRYRIRAYRRAAYALLRMRQPVAARLAAGKPLGIARLGPSLTAKISSLARDGTLPFYDQLLATLPFDQQRLLAVPGIGPTIAARIHREIGTTDPIGLAYAARTGRLQRIWGIGPRRTKAILTTLGAPMPVQQVLAF